MPFDVTRAMPVFPGASPLNQPGLPARTTGSVTPSPAQEGPSFAETLKTYLSDVAELQQEASRHVQGLTEGKPAEVHQIMLAMEEAGLALDLLIEIRNRLLEAYQELTRTPL